MERKAGWLIVGTLLFGWVAGSEGATTKITHTPPSHMVPGYRLHITAAFDDPAGIVEARCYFRAVNADDYVFIVLEESAPGAFYGVLPPPADTTSRLEYLFQALNGNDEIVSTQPVVVPVQEDATPPWQADVMLDVFRVMTERSRAGWQVPGFARDNTVHVVDSSRRYGAVSDIYPGVDPGETVATDAGLVDITPEPTPSEPAGPQDAKPPRGNLARNLVLGGIVAGAAGGAAYALSDSDSDDEEEIEETMPDSSVEVDLIANESFSVTSVLYATGTASGPSGARFRLEVEGPIEDYSRTVTIGDSNQASIRMEIGEDIFSCSTYVVTGTVTDADGTLLATRTRTFSYMCE